MDGIVVIDKPEGMTSAGVVARVKRILGAKKVGHTGTLDPFATGLLVCCIGRATRLARFFLHGEKGYDATMRLGIETDTQDLTGTQVSQAPDEDVAAITRERFLEVMQGFTGEISQAPPVYSALKQDGTPLYKLARAGKPVQKPPRQVHIYELELLEFAPPMVRFFARCSGGTYIRSLCSDMGAQLGCGAHLSALRRTQNSGFGIEEGVDLDTLQRMADAGRAHDAFQTMANALRRMPEIVAAPLARKKIRHGQALTWHDLGSIDRRGNEKSGPVKVVDDDRNLLAVLDPRADGTGLDYACVFAS